MILPEIEAQHSDGDGLLSDNGASRGNLFTGDAKHVMATASTITARDGSHRSANYQAYFANPYTVVRTLLHFLGDIVLEIRQYRWAQQNNIKPILDKHHRGWKYRIIRAATAVLMLNLNIDTLLGDMFAGRSSAYATFVGYDEVAHHAGLLDPGAFDILRKIDKAFGRLEMAIADAPRPYHLVVLSDHGQTSGATFLQRYSMTLEELVQRSMAEDIKVLSSGTPTDAEGHLDVLLNDIAQNEESKVAKTVAGAIHKQTLGRNSTDQSDQVSSHDRDHDDSSKPDVYVLASGNLGLVSFTEWNERMTLEEIELAFPAVISALTEHEGIGFVMVRSREKGPLVIGAKGIYYLENDYVEGENPLENFGPHAADHLRRTDSFPNCPDILVNSFYDPEKEEGCAFEELIGFHGGLGGLQTQPFILHPVALKVETELVGATSVYRVCKDWLTQLQNGSANSDV
jgi:hypothetical protein